MTITYAQQNLRGISPNTRIKLKLLSVALGKPMTRLVELMTDRLWEEKSDLVSMKVTQNEVDTAARRILKSLVPK